MIDIRKSGERGHSQMGWLSSYHTFSFAQYYEPKCMGFGNLRVINEDTVQPGCGFDMHSHNNMEIISYVVAGSLAHKDSLGTGSVIQPGEIQIMSAGTGIQHSEFNYSKTELLHFLQIWIIPDRDSLKPNYEQKTLQKTNNKFILLASENKQNEAVLIHQKVALYAAYFLPGFASEYFFKETHQGWIQLIKGRITINNIALSAGDGAAIINESIIAIECLENAEFLIFDLG